MAQDYFGRLFPVVLNRPFRSFGHDAGKDAAMPRLGREYKRKLRRAPMRRRGWRESPAKQRHSNYPPIDDTRGSQISIRLRRSQTPTRAKEPVKVTLNLT